MSEYIKTGYTEVRLQQIDSTEIAVEDADNSDNPGEPEVVALVVQNFEDGERLAIVQLTEEGARKLHSALGARLDGTK